MTQLFVEIFCEEIPARFQTRAAQDFERLARDALVKAGLAPASFKTAVSPRHLALAVEGLASEIAPQTVERKGPRTDAPEAAIAGFLKSAGVTLEACVREETPKGTFLIARTHVPSRPTREILAPLLEELILSFPWPQTMRWGTGTKGWVRPVHSLVVLFNGEVLPVTLRFGEREDAPRIVAGRTTQGHRFLAPTPFEVSSFDDYVTKLEAAHVFVLQDVRRARIETALASALEGTGLRLSSYPGLLEEVTGLVESPHVYLGTIDAAFMTLPKEILATTMRVHQRYFPLEEENGRLAPRFAFVAASPTQDAGALVTQGNERVLRARLSDALFYYDLDRKTPLKAHAEKLASLVFHAKLGTMADKAARLGALCADLAGMMGIDTTLAKDAGLLAKADLVTGVVHEFPEIQGIMGGYYARAQNLDETLACALAQQYLPKGPEDALPEGVLSKLLALADRLDTLVGFCAVGIMPTGSGDPFALRRAALGILRLLEDASFDVSLPDLIEKAYALYGAQPTFGEAKPLSLEDTKKTLLAFFEERIKVLWSKDFRPDHIAAAVRVHDPIWQTRARCSALKVFFGTSQDSARLLAAFKRGANILRLEEEKDGASYTGVLPQEALFQQDAEKALFKALKDTEKALPPLLAAKDFQECLQTLSTLSGPIDTFFEDVTVNDDARDVRRNRLALLAHFKECLERVAHFRNLED
ncbi:MAG: glycine--tRNA ligase subunit beta [Proteobacteria bacterium]|nr:glycine--tRNA ligase subunit beta [Pseudomonadota bacterium]